MIKVVKVRLKDALAKELAIALAVHNERRKTHTKYLHDLTAS